MINVIISTQPQYRVNNEAIKQVVMQVLKLHNIAQQVEIGVNIVGDKMMHELNKKYRNIDAPTDILSFCLEDPIAQNLQHFPRVGFVPAPDQWLRLGDVVIAYPQAVKDASLDGIAVEEEILYLVEHGTKHLLGIHTD
jgi:probable rRNA maturation factor